MTFRRMISRRLGTGALLCVCFLTAALWAQQPAATPPAKPAPADPSLQSPALQTPGAQKPALQKPELQKPVLQKPVLQKEDWRISGTVVDSDTKQPLSATHVVAAPVGKTEAFTTVTTGEDGRFVFAHLQAGKYTLTAQRRGYVAQSFDQHGQFSTSVAIGPGLDPGELVFPLLVEGAISGAVSDEQGEAVRNARVTLFQTTADDGQRATHMHSTAMTDDEGHYRFSHLRPGRYFIAVSAQPWYARPQETIVRAPDGGVTTYSGDSIMTSSPPAPAGGSSGLRSGAEKTSGGLVIEESPPSPLDVAYPFTFYAGAMDAASATPIVLGKGDRFSADISLHPLPAAHFRINTGETDGKTYFVTLDQKLFDGSMTSPFAQNHQIAPGIVEITGIPPGHYIVNIHNMSSGAMQALRQQEVEIGGSGSVDSTAGAALVPVTAALSFEPPATASAQFNLQLRDKTSGQVFRQPVAGKGDLEFRPGIPPGSYEISLQGARELYLKQIHATGASLAGRTLRIKSAPVKLTLLAAQGLGEISGITLKDDKPMAGAMIVLAPADPANNRILFRRDQSDSDGTFKISNVIPGQYTVLAIADGWELEWAEPGVLAKFLPQGQTINLEPRGKIAVKVKAQ